MSQETIEEKAEEVREDLELHAGYMLSNKQLDELIVTGRVGIDFDKFSNYLKDAISYLKQCEDEDVVWTLMLNTVSCDVEITLKNYYIYL